MVIDKQQLCMQCKNFIGIFYTFKVQYVGFPQGNEIIPGRCGAILGSCRVVSRSFKVIN